MGTDFFDDDLRAESGEAGDEREVDTRTSDEADMEARLVKQKEELSSKVAGAVNEIERLRMRQEQLEKEKNKLEELSRKQEDYENGKADMIDRLDRSLVLIEKEEEQAAEMVELLGETRKRFRQGLGELRNIDEGSWVKQKFEEELNRALALVEDCRMVYKKAWARIEASEWRRTNSGEKLPPTAEYAARERAADKGFGFWVKVGLAVSLPLTTVLVVLFVLWLLLTGIL